VRLSLSFWLALVAIILAMGAVVVRLALGKFDDLGDTIGPIAISLLMFGIVVREWNLARGKRDHG
jgi:hypothetical protein